MIALAHSTAFADLDAQNNVAKRPRLFYSTDNSLPFSSPEDSAIIIQRGLPRKPQLPKTTTYPQPSMPKCTEHLAEINDVSQCRLKRIQSSRDGVNVVDISTTTATATPMRAHVPPSVVPSSASEAHSPTHTLRTCSSDSAPSPSPDLQSPVESDSSTDSDTELDTETDPDAVPRYPFPPPGLSKHASSSQTMIISELEADSCTPGEYELKCGLENPAVSQGHHHHESSIWNSFQIESFLGNYCPGNGSRTPSSTIGLKSGGGSPAGPQWSLQVVAPQRNCHQPIPPGPDPSATDSDSDSDYDYCDYDLEYSSSRLDRSETEPLRPSLPPAISISISPILTPGPRQYHIHHQHHHHHHHYQQQQQYSCGGNLIPPAPSPSLTSPPPSTPTPAPTPPTPAPTPPTPALALSPPAAPAPVPDYPLVIPVPRYPVRVLGGGSGSGSGIHPTALLIDPQVLLRQRQKAYVTGWSQLRERRKRIGVGPAPVMPSLMNPMRAAAPTGTWTLLREVLCEGDGGSAGRHANMFWRKGKQSTFERPLNAGLGRSRIICDRMRKDQQDAFGFRWGLHAWLGPTKHCRHCASDGLLKGLLAYRAYEGERVRRLVKEAEMNMMAQPVLDVDGQGSGHEEGTVFLSYPYVCQVQDPFIEDGGVTSENAEDVPDRGLDSGDVESWSEEMEKRLLQSPVIKDLDEFGEDGEGGYYEDEYGEEESDEDEESSEESSSESSEEDEDKEKEKEVLKSFWEEDDEEWREEKIEVAGFEGVQEVQVAEVQVMPEVQIEA